MTVTDFAMHVQRDTTTRHSADPPRPAISPPMPSRPRQAPSSLPHLFDSHLINREVRVSVILLPGYQRTIPSQPGFARGRIGPEARGSAAQPPVGHRVAHRATHKRRASSPPAKSSTPACRVRTSATGQVMSRLASTREPQCQVTRPGLNPDLVGGGEWGAIYEGGWGAGGGGCSWARAGLA